MSDILISNMELPKQGWLKLIILPNGEVRKVDTGNEAVIPTESKAVDYPSPWQTGTPTKGGWYLLKVMHEDEIVYDANLLEDNTDDLQWRYAMSMYGKVIAYKEIEP